MKPNLHWEKKQSWAAAADLIIVEFGASPELKMLWVAGHFFKSSSLISVRNAGDICVKPRNAINSRVAQLPAKDTRLECESPPPHSNYTGIINLTFKTGDQWNLLLANMGRFRRVISLKGGVEEKNADIVDYCNLIEELHHRSVETNYSLSKITNYARNGLSLSCILFLFPVKVTVYLQLSFHQRGLFEAADRSSYCPPANSTSSSRNITHAWPVAEARNPRSGIQRLPTCPL